MIGILHIPTGAILECFPTYLHFRALFSCPKKYSFVYYRNNLSSSNKLRISSLLFYDPLKSGTIKYLEEHYIDIINIFIENSIIPNHKNYTDDIKYIVETLSLLEFEVLV